MPQPFKNHTLVGGVLVDDDKCLPRLRQDVIGKQLADDLDVREFLGFQLPHARCRTGVISGLYRRYALHGVRGRDRCRTRRHGRRHIRNGSRYFRRFFWKFLRVVLRIDADEVAGRDGGFGRCALRKAGCRMASHWQSERHSAGIEGFPFGLSDRRLGENGCFRLCRCRLLLQSRLGYRGRCLLCRRGRRVGE